MIIGAALAALGKKYFTQENIEKVITILNGQDDKVVAPWRKNVANALKVIAPFMSRKRQIQSLDLATSLNISRDGAKSVCDALVQQKLIRPSHEDGVYTIKGLL